MRIAICDDDQDFQKFLSAAVQSHGASGPCVIDLYARGMDFLESLKSTGYDMVFLDLCLPDISGQELARHLHEDHPQTVVIILSRFDEYARYAFEDGIHRYILKNELGGKLGEALRTAVRKIRKRNVVLLFESDDGSRYPVRIHDIQYFEAFRRHVLVHTRARTIRLKTTVSFRKIDEIFREHGFIPCHKGLLVHPEAIDRFEGQTIRIADGSCLPLSRRSEKQVMSLYRRYIEELIV